MLEINKRSALEISERYYFGPIKNGLEEIIAQSGSIESLDHLTEVMQKATAPVEKLIGKRIRKGKITSADQARKTIAGNGFQGLVAYSLIKLQEEGVLSPNIAITLKPKHHSLVEKYATIKVGDDTQKPDIDLLIYNHPAPEKFPIIIYSIKTSLRERAGQTYRWKLLMDIASSQDCKTIKEKYTLSYTATDNFKVGFITTNFYSEIMKPQQQGMLRFFDFVYITKPRIENERIKGFSKVVGDLNKIYS